MPCSICPHPTCRHSMIQQGVCSCPECDGTLVLDPISAPKWRLDCNKCNCLVYLPHNAHRISVSKDHCDDCGSALLEVSLHAILQGFWLLVVLPKLVVHICTSKQVSNS
jgi:DNA topoisomerase-3